jgi:hypothetical protein
MLRGGVCVRTRSTTGPRGQQGNEATAKTQGSTKESSTEESSTEETHQDKGNKEMMVKATDSASFPPGRIWACGEVAEIKLEKGQKLPSWLVKVEAKKAPKAKTDKPDAG